MKDLTPLSEKELITEHRRLLDVTMNINTRLAVAKAFPSEAGLDEREDAMLREENERVESELRRIGTEIRVRRNEEPQPAEQPPLD